MLKRLKESLKGRLTMSVHKSASKVAVDPIQLHTVPTLSTESQGLSVALAVLPGVGAIYLNLHPVMR